MKAKVPHNIATEKGWRPFKIGLDQPCQREDCQFNERHSCLKMFNGGTPPEGYGFASLGCRGFLRLVPDREEHRGASEGHQDRQKVFHVTAGQQTELTGYLKR